MAYQYYSDRKFRNLQGGSNAFSGFRDIARSVGGLIENEKNEAERLAKAEQAQNDRDVEIRVSAYLYGDPKTKTAGALNDILKIKDGSLYDGEADTAWENAVNADQIAQDLGISVDSVNDTLSRNKTRWKSQWDRAISNAKVDNKKTNLEVEQMAYSTSLATDTSMTLEENLKAQRESYGKSSPDLWDANGQYDPSKPRYGLVVADIYGLEVAKDELAELIANDNLISKEDAIDKVMENFTKGLDSIDMASATNEEKLLKENLVKEARSFLEGTGKSSDPEMKSYDAVVNELITASEQKGLRAADEIEKIKGNGDAVSLSEIAGAFADSGLNIDSYYDQQEMVGLLTSTNNWNLAKSNEDVIAGLGEYGFDQIKEDIWMSDYSTEKSVTITMDGKSFTESEGKTPFEASLARLLSPSKSETVKKSSVDTQLLPLAKKICKEQGITSDEGLFQVVTYLNDVAAAKTKVVLAANGNKLQAIVTDSGLTTQEKKNRIRAMVGMVEDDAYKKALNSVYFDYADERDAMFDSLKTSFKSAFGDQGSDMYYDLIGNAGFEDDLEKWIVTQAQTEEGLSTKSINEFILSTTQAFAEKHVSTKVMGEVDRFFNKASGWHDTSEINNLDAMGVFQIWGDWQNGMYTTLIDNDVVYRAEKAIKIQFGNDRKDVDGVKDSIARDIFGDNATYEGLSEVDQRVCDLNLCAALGSATIAQTLENNFGEEVLGKPTKMVTTNGYGRAMISSAGYVYIQNNPEVNELSNEPNSFLIGYMNPRSKEFQDIWNGGDDAYLDNNGLDLWNFTAGHKPAMPGENLFRSEVWLPTNEDPRYWHVVNSISAYNPKYGNAPAGTPMMTMTNMTN